MNRILTLTFAFALSACASTASKPTVSADMPPFGVDKPPPVPQIVQRTLANGLNVWIVPRDGLPRVDAVFVLRGFAVNDAQAPGRSQLLANLLAEGTKTRSSRQIAEEFQAIGGHVQAFADAETLTLNAQSLASQSSKLIELLADVTRNADFPEKEVALAKTNALQDLAATEASPAYVAGRAYDRALFGTHPYALVYPTATSIKAATRQSLKAAYAGALRPDRALLVVAGRITADAGFDLAQKFFGDWKVSAPASASDALPPPSPQGVKRLLVNRPGSVQSNIRVGRLAVSATDADRIPLALADRILGGYFGSRITQNIRENKGYSYTPGGYVAFLRSGGGIVSYAEVRNEVTGPALGEIFKEMDGMTQAAVGDEELRRAKRFNAGVYLFRAQQQSVVAQILAGRWALGLPADDFVTFVPRSDAVTAAQVQDISKKYFSRGDQTVVIVGDAAAIAPQLTSYGEFETVAP